ncbi:phenolic acid decarboxylase [Enterobacter sp. RHBSTW-00901]|nr:phenolic acid decarboxylase [Enterobacter sp. RHBSTW-00901]
MARALYYCSPGGRQCSLTELIDEYTTITFVRGCGANNDSIIACSAGERPDNFSANLNETR